ncbi:MAG: Gfo/Idh/MocA family oxidoreductase [Clostridiaceae bacterium]
MKQITVALAGAGIRGMEAYAPYALKHPEEMKFVAVAEPDPERLEKFKKLYSINDEMCFKSWEELLAKPKLADAMFICTQDKMHFAPSMAAMGKGYHILLEKPMATDPAECIKMGELAGKLGRVFMVCHVLRYTPFFIKLKSLLQEGVIGRLISIQHNENVGYWHQAHSFVRGQYRDSAASSPMILAKSCHDMDIMLWLVGKDCVRLSSFGSLTHFRSENAPEGAPERCLDGCPHSATCNYYAPSLYLTENTDWPTNAISNSMAMIDRVQALKTGPYGKCVYRCDNNVVDHQVVSIEFEDGITAAFTMCAFTRDVSRTLKLMGTEGEIRGAMEKNEIEIIPFNGNEKKVISLKEQKSGHGGGDEAIVREFIRLVQSGEDVRSISATESTQGTLMAFAAEEARVTNRVVAMKEYVKQKLLR